MLRVDLVLSRSSVYQKHFEPLNRRFSKGSIRWFDITTLGCIKNYANKRKNLVKLLKKDRVIFKLARLGLQS